MSSGDIKHVFIFHKDGELRPTSSPQSEVVVAGEQDEEKRYHKDSKHTTLTLETNTIRMRSACINSSIVSSSNRATHVWPDPVRGINAKMLRYVVENLSAEELCWKGTRQLEEVSGICIAIWSLQCSRKPFQKAADSVLQKHKIEFGKVQEAEWLTIITFVLGKDDDLKQHLKNLIWQSGGALKCPIEYLQDWVNSE
jgi:hypothetical protein